jgi:1-acyl-sn-glycerol-3-phosphate acyltransferase
VFSVTDDPTTSENRVLRYGWSLFRFYMGGYHGVRPLTACTLPAAGPAILVSNHVSSLDPLILQLCCPRLIVWMMAREYYEIPGLEWFFRTVEAIPVDRRGRDLAATRSAIRALEAGRIVGIFPQGRIGENGEEVPFQTGVAMVAIKTGVPVYPARIEGSIRDTGMVEAFAYPQRVTVAFGEAVGFDRSSDSREAIEIATSSIRSAVFALAPHASRPGRGC